MPLVFLRTSRRVARVGYLMFGGRGPVSLSLSFLMCCGLSARTRQDLNGGAFCSRFECLFEPGEELGDGGEGGKGLMGCIPEDHTALDTA